MGRDRETRREPTAGQRAAGGTFTLWYGFLVGPVAWSLHLLLTYPLVPQLCPHGLDWLLHVITAVTALACVVGVVLAWQAWNRLKEQGPRAGADPAAARDAAWEVGGRGRLSASRARFMALGGIVLSGFFAVVIVIEGLPPFFGPC
jgi:hypothetical protein